MFILGASEPTSQTYLGHSDVSEVDLLLYLGLTRVLGLGFRVLGFARQGLVRFRAWGSGFLCCFAS